MIRPPSLRKDDTIGIVAPSSALAGPEITPAVDLIRSWGLKTVMGRNLFRSTNSFAGTDVQRAADFQHMLDDADIRAIVCARGGYGAIRLIGDLDFSQFQKHPKWIAGCSDITVFHARVQQLGIESLHSAMPRFVPPQKPHPVSMESLRTALFGEIREYTVKAHPFNRQGKARGILTGGNLSVLYSMAGSSLDTDTRGKILFIEDIGEYLYHIDRMMMNLKIRGRLEGLKGLIVGSMSNMMVSGSGYRKPAYRIIRDALDGYGYPVMYGFPAGHVHPNMSLILGADVEMIVGEDGCRLEFISV